MRQEPIPVYVVNHPGQGRALLIIFGAYLWIAAITAAAWGIWKAQVFLTGIFGG